jgi:hypothetical protein
MTVAADPDPYFALPKLYGAPAYARPPRVVAESERPFDPDDLPIVAEMTDEERAFAADLAPSASYQLAATSRSAPAGGASADGSFPGSNGHAAAQPGSNGHAAASGPRFGRRLLGGRRGASPK